MVRVLDTILLSIFYGNRILTRLMSFVKMIVLKRLERV